MTRAYALRRLDRGIMRAFSRRTVAALRDFLPVRIVLPHVEPVLEANVAKEIEKDALIIGRAAQLLTANTRPDDDHAVTLFEETQSIDRSFLELLRIGPVGLEIRYEFIRPVRLQRIKRLLSFSHALLSAWSGEAKLRSTLRSIYTPSEFKQIVTDLLELYAQETRLLSQSVRLPFLPPPVRDMFAEALFNIMSRIAADLGSEITASVFRHDRR